MLVPYPQNQIRKRNQLGSNTELMTIIDQPLLLTSSRQKVDHLVRGGELCTTVGQPARCRLLEILQKKDWFLPMHLHTYTHAHAQACTHVCTQSQETYRIKETQLVNFIFIQISKIFKNDINKTFKN